IACALSASFSNSAGISDATTDVTYSSKGTCSVSPLSTLLTSTSTVFNSISSEFSLIGPFTSLLSCDSFDVLGTETITAGNKTITAKSKTIPKYLGPYELDADGNDDRHFSIFFLDDIFLSSDLVVTYYASCTLHSFTRIIGTHLYCMLLHPNSRTSDDAKKAEAFDCPA